MTTATAPSPGHEPGPGTLEDAAARLARLLTTGGDAMSDPTGSDLEFEAELRIRPLEVRPAPVQAWAVDGGQALVADARCLQVVVVRAARVCFAGGSCTVEDEGELSAWLLGAGGNRPGGGSPLGLGVAPGAPIDVNLLRDHQEWQAVAACVEDAAPGSVVLVDGDLQPDWRIPSTFLSGLLARAAERGIVLAGVTKRSSLSRGGAPLLGHLEAEAESLLGPRARWWVPVARTRPDLESAPGPSGPGPSGPPPEAARAGGEWPPPGGGSRRASTTGTYSRGSGGPRVVVARLDPDARFAFRVDLPGDPDVDPEAVLGAMAALSDDAAFPGYPYPLTVADRLAACPGWVRSEARRGLDDHLDRFGVALDVRERAFADRHDLMERY